MRRFKNVAPPDVRLLIPIKIHAFMQSALNADLLNSWKFKLRPHPTREILIRGLIEPVIQKLVIERRDASGKLFATWMFRKQTVHDVATTQGSSPRLHHLAFAVPAAHHILHLADVMGAVSEEECLERGPGRHGVSNAFYLYLRDPDGHRVEIYTTDYYTGDPGHQALRWDVNDPRRRDFWGNPVVPRWYDEASRVLDLDGNVEPLRERISDEKAITVGADGLGITRPTSP